MIESVQFNLLVKDLGSAPLAKFASNANKQVNKVMKVTKGLEGILSTTNQKANTLNSTFGKLGKRNRFGINKELTTANGQMDRLINKANKYKMLNRSSGPGLMSGAGMMGGAAMMGAIPRPTRSPFSARIPLGGLGSVATNYVAPIALFAGFTNMIKAGAQFESKLVDIKGILSTSDGFGESAFDGLIKKVRTLGADTIFTMRQVADATKYMAMAGLNIDQINKSLPAVTNIAAVGNMGIESAADIVTNISTGFGISAERLTDVADVLTGTFTRTNVTLLEQGEAFAYAGNVAAQNGIKFEELASAIGILGNAGIKGSRAGTNLRQLILRLAAPTEKGKEVMEKYGLSFTRMAADGRTVLKPLREIVKQINDLRLSAGEKKDLFNIFGGQAFGAIGTQFDKDGKLLIDSLQDKLGNVTGISDALSKAKMKTFSGQVAILQANFENLSISLFNKVKPGLTQIISATTGFIQFLNGEGSFVLTGIGNAFTVLGNALKYGFQGLQSLLLLARDNWHWLKYVAGGLLAINVYMRGLLFITRVTTGFMAFTRALMLGKFAIMGVNVALLASPIGWILGGITALTAGVIYAWNNFTGFRVAVFAAWESLKLMWKGVLEWGGNVVSLFKYVWGYIDPFFTRWKEQVTQQFQVYVQAFKILKNFIIGNLPAIQEKFMGFFMALKPVLQTLSAPFQLIMTLFDKVSEIYDQLKEQEWFKKLVGASGFGLLKAISNQYTDENIAKSAKNVRESVENSSNIDLMNSINKLTEKFQVADPTNLQTTFGKLNPITSQIKADVGEDSVSSSTGKSGKSGIAGGLGDNISISGPSSSGSISAAGIRNIYVNIENLLNIEELINNEGEVENVLDQVADGLVDVVRDVELGLSN